MRRAPRRFQALFDGFPEAVGVLWAVRDDDGRIVDFAFGYGNPSMLRNFRVPLASRDRYTLLEALPRVRGGRTFDAFVRVCDSGQPWVQEITYDTPFGDGYVLGTFVHRTAKLGDGLVNFLTDVTEQRRMEAELRSYADVVAHDLSEPIAGIELLVRLLERRAEEPPSADVLRRLRASTERARDLIDGVLVYAQAGELSVERVALGRLAAEVAEDLGPSLEAAGAALEIGELPEVDGDPRQLRRVLQNLIGNALKFRGQAPPRIELSALRDSHEWVVTVRDNGVGVDPDQASRIFEMFSRANSETEGVGHRPGGVPPHNRGPRRAHLGRGRRQRRQRLSLHDAPLSCVPRRPLELVEARTFGTRGQRASVTRPSGLEREAFGSVDRPGIGSRTAPGRLLEPGGRASPHQALQRLTFSRNAPHTAAAHPDPGVAKPPGLSYARGASALARRPKAADRSAPAQTTAARPVQQGAGPWGALLLSPREQHSSGVAARSDR